MHEIKLCPLPKHPGNSSFHLRQPQGWNVVVWWDVSDSGAFGWRREGTGKCCQRLPALTQGHREGTRGMAWLGLVWPRDREVHGRAASLLLPAVAGWGGTEKPLTAGLQPRGGPERNMAGAIPLCQADGACPGRSHLRTAGTTESPWAHGEVPAQLRRIPFPPLPPKRPDAAVLYKTSPVFTNIDIKKPPTNKKKQHDNHC